MSLKRESQLEKLFAFHCRAQKVAEPVREHRFAPPRMWRFDFAWPDRMVAAEVEGGIWSNGRHTRGSGFQADAEKYNTAALAGWRVFRFTGTMVSNGTAILTIQRALESA